jgi:hypothetical protein
MKKVKLIKVLINYSDFLKIEKIFLDYGLAKAMEEGN